MISLYVSHFVVILLTDKYKMLCARQGKHQQLCCGVFFCLAWDTLHYISHTRTLSDNLTTHLSLSKFPEASLAYFDYFPTYSHGLIYFHRSTSDLLIHIIKSYFHFLSLHNHLFYTFILVCELSHFYS